MPANVAVLAICWPARSGLNQPFVGCVCGSTEGLSKRTFDVDIVSGRCAYCAVSDLGGESLSVGRSSWYGVGDPSDVYFTGRHDGLAWLSLDSAK